MMLKGAYIDDVDCSKGSLGVCKKIEAMIRAFRFHNIHINRYSYSNKLNNVSRFNRLLLFLNPFYSLNNFPTNQKLSELDFSYIRKPLVDRNFIKFIKNLKSRNNAKLIMEVPTYPYSFLSGETSSIKFEFIRGFPLFIKEFIY